MVLKYVGLLASTNGVKMAWLYGALLVKQVCIFIRRHVCLFLLDIFLPDETVFPQDGSVVVEADTMLGTDGETLSST